MEPPGERLKHLVGRIENVPTLPTVVARILAATQDPDTSAEDVNRIILSDQALTAKVLKLVNSAFYGFPRRVGTVTEAIVILGFGTIRNLAITASVFKVFGRQGTGRFDRAAFWRHCLGVGVVSRALAGKMGIANREDVFVAGLLHDLGKVILDQHWHEAFVEALARVESESCTLYQAEQEVLGVSHAEVGMWLAERWNMPEFLSLAMGLHHRPGDAPEPFPVVSLVHVADVLTRFKGIGNAGDPVQLPLQTEALARLKFKREYLESVMGSIDAELEEAAGLLEIF